MGFLPIIAVALLLLELMGIYWIGQWLGIWTLLWLAGAVLAGVALIRLEHATLAPRLMQTLLHGEAPLRALLGIGLRFLAGVLLILPGALSDIVALILLLFTLGHRAPTRAPGPPPNSPPPQGPTSSGEVIEGEFRRMD